MNYRVISVKSSFWLTETVEVILVLGLGTSYHRLTNIYQPELAQGSMSVDRLENPPPDAHTGNGWQPPRMKQERAKSHRSTAMFKLFVLLFNCGQSLVFRISLAILHQRRTKKAGLLSWSRICCIHHIC